jgi:hypothetical protein
MRRKFAMGNHGREETGTRMGGIIIHDVATEMSRRRFASNDRHRRSIDIHKSEIKGT